MGRPKGSENRSNPHPQRFYQKFTRSEGCWIWHSGTNADGYGVYSYKGRRCMAHRIAYELFVGPIPPGFQIDHVKERGCTSRACVNPAHLEVVTLQENVRRGNAPPAIHARQQSCKSGHPFTADSTYVTKEGHRKCRTCHREQERARYAARKAV